jgi:CBS domain-containing protein
MLARDIMTKNPLVVTQDTKVEDIIDIMDKQGIEMVPVVDEQANKRLIGIVSRSDILMEKISKELYNMK